MATYRVLLVDDEEDIRVGISRKMDWASLDLELVGEAENGQDALELAEQLKPDIVLTDIKMPFMDGLELCRILTVRLPASKFVIFSGFDDFEYAKQAIQMNVSEYILKPINAAELTAVLQRLRGQLDTERAELQNMETLRTRYAESLPVLRELFFTHLLEGRVPPAQIAGRAAQLELELTGERWVVALTHCELDSEQRALLLLSVRQLFDDELPRYGCTVKSFLYSDAVALLVGCTAAGFSVYRFIEEVNRVCKLAKSYLNLTLTVGIGEPCDTPAALPQALAGARSALDYRMLVGAGRAIYIGDLEPDSTTHLSFDENDERDLVGAVKLGTEEEVRAVVERLMAKIRDAGLALSQCQLYFLELITCLLKLTRGAGPEEIFGPGFTGAMQITDFGSTGELGAWYFERCMRIRDYIGRQRSDSAGRTVEKARAFIAEHYAESELSVEMLCEHLHLSPAYFSTLFKRETGMSFTASVTVERMERAAALLRDTEEKTYLIAEQVGYRDPNYFSYVFKRHFGVSPTKFRTR